MGLTARELAALEGLLAAQRNLSEKYGRYARAAEDPQLRVRFEQIAASHRNHFDRLLEQLD